MRLAWRLARREVRRRPGRTLLVVTMVAVTVAGITVADLAYRSHELPEPEAFGRAASRLQVSLGDGDTRDALELARSVVPDGVESVSGWEVIGLPVQRDDHRGKGMFARLWTVDVRAPLLRGAVQLQQGALPSEPDEVLLGSAAATRLELNVGDTLQLARPRIDLRVVGIGDTVDSKDLFLAPGYPTDELRQGLKVAVVYADVVLDGLGSVQPTIGAELPPSWFVSTPPVPQPTNYSELLIGWLVATLLLSVLGIVIAAAFAASGRRQLVTLGQLGAVGGGERLARTFLGLQGSLTGLIGALAGVGLGVAIAELVGDPIVRNDRMDIVLVDLAIVVATTVVVATGAALLPTRRLAAAPVLTALAGRVPQREVGRASLVNGVAIIAVGLVVLGGAVASTRDGGSSEAVAGIVIALLGVGAILGGMCAVSPFLIDRWGRVGGRAEGTTRLAVRSLARQRARSAALVAAIAAVGAVGIAGASGIERWSQLRSASPWPERLDVLTVGSGSSAGQPGEPPQVSAETKADVESVVGPVEWHAVRYVGPVDGAVDFLYGDDATLAALGVPASLVPSLRSVDSVWLRREGTSFEVDSIAVPDLALPFVRVVDPMAAAELGLRTTQHMLIGVTPRPLTAKQREELTVVSFAQSDGFYFVTGERQMEVFHGIGVSWESPYVAPIVTRAAARWIVIGALLALVMFIVGIGLALWAAEGKVERDQLVAIGAEPRSLAGMAGIRAWVLAVTGAAMAVPLGMITLWVVLRAVSATSPFPTVTAVMLVVVLPLVVAVVSYGGSRMAQRLRPADGGAMSLD
jgi:hypothetical protein